VVGVSAVQSRSITITWSTPAQSNGQLTAYKVYRTSASQSLTGYPATSDTSRQEVASVGPSTTSAVITGLAPATDYVFVVTASTAGGESQDSSQAQATTLDEAPSRPGVPTVEVLSTSTLRVSWTQPTLPLGAIIRYEVVLNGVTVAFSGLPSPSNLTALITGLDEDRTYEVTVIAYTSAGSSVPSLESRARTVAKDVDITPVIVVVVTLLFVAVLAIGYRYERARRLVNTANLHKADIRHKGGMGMGMGMGVLPSQHRRQSQVVPSNRNTVMTETLASDEDSDEEAGFGSMLPPLRRESVPPVQVPIGTQRRISAPAPGPAFIRQNGHSNGPVALPRHVPSPQRLPPLKQVQHTPAE
jgi:hypothetical protein